MELTKLEFHLLSYLKESGFLYIARDEDDILNVYKEKPKKGRFYWRGGDDRGIEEYELFSFVTWDNEEPKLIEDLIKNGVEE